MKYLAAAAALATASLCSTSASAATLIYQENGTLTGAAGVIVGGAAYDVTFVDGTCILLFSGCDAQSDFTPINGAAAANALLEQVFVFLFDEAPAFTRGCTFEEQCRTLIPTTLGAVIGGTRSFTGTQVINNAGDATDSTQNFLAFADLNTDTNPSLNFAIFTPSQVAAVPEPGTWVMMLIGLGAIGASMRRRKSSIRTLA